MSAARLATLIAAVPSADAPAAPPARPAPDLPDPQQLFCEAVRDGWNLESEWLWLATVVDDIAQRRYCYDRALYINPQSEVALAERRARSAGRK